VSSPAVRPDSLLELESCTLRVERRNTICEMESSKEGQRSPVFKLPPEILSRIFLSLFELHCIGTSLSIRDMNGVMKIVHCNMRVCKSWRDVIQHTPQLWSYLAFGEYEKPEIQTALLRRYQTCSGDSPLQVELNASTIEGLSYLWAKFIRPVINRCTRIAFVTHGFLRVSSQIFPSIDEDLSKASRLESLQIQTQRFHSENRSGLADPISSIPELNISSFHLRYSSLPLFKAPFLREITMMDLRLGTQDVDRLQALLVGSSRLESIVLCHVDGAGRSRYTTLGELPPAHQTVTEERRRSQFQITTSGRSEHQFYNCVGQRSKVEGRNYK
jgi:hypothetical protein